MTGVVSGRPRLASHQERPRCVETHQHIRGTQHHVNKHSETHIWIEFRVKQPTLTPDKVQSSAHRKHIDRLTLNTANNSLAVRSLNESKHVGSHPSYSKLGLIQVHTAKVNPWNPARPTRYDGLRVWRPTARIDTSRRPRYGRPTPRPS